MKNSPRGSVAVLLLLIIVILLAVIGWLYFKQSIPHSTQAPESESVTPHVPPPSSAALTDQDILNAKYLISANFGGKMTAPQEVKLPYVPFAEATTDRLYITPNGTVLINPSPEPNNAETFWISKYEFTDSTHAEADVFVGGNYGASAEDDREFLVKKVNGNVVTSEITGHTEG